MPTTTTVTRSLGSYGSVTMTVNQYEMTYEASTSSLAITGLATGTWRCTAGMGARPKQGYYLPSFDSGAVTSGSITVPAMALNGHLDMDAGAGDVYFWVNLYAVQSSRMVLVASTWSGNESDSAVTIPAAPAAATAQVTWGADSNWAKYTGSGTTLAMTPYPNNAYIFASMYSAGIRVVRVPVVWQYLAPTGTQGGATVLNATAQTNYAAIFSALNTAGLKAVIATGANGPKWATPGGTGSWGDVPANWTDYANFVTAILGQWGAYVSAVENENEPNDGAGNVNTSNYPGWTFAALSSSQQNLYTKVKAYSGTIKVGTCGIAYGDQSFLTTLYGTSGWKGTYDYISCHPYPVRFDKVGLSVSPGTALNELSIDPLYAWGDSGVGLTNGYLSGINQLRKVMVANGESAKTIRIMEIGWNTIVANQNLSNSSFLFATEPEQAIYLRTAMRQAARLPYVDMLSIWSANDATLGDTNGPASAYTSQGFGLMDALGVRAKQSWWTVGATITAIAGGTG
jgi:hypothetical protein